jgi:Fe-S cluster assembly iron-binding protein IscA
MAAWSLVVLLGLGAFAVALVAAMPVRFAVAMVGVSVPVTDLSGTVLQGQGQLAGGHLVQWDAAGWDSWATLALVYDVRVTGPQTDLAGRVALRPARAVIGPLAGQAGWPLVTALMPGVQIACDGVAEVRIGSVILTREMRQAVGRVTVDKGVCARVDGTMTGVPVPALDVDIATVEDGVQAVVTSDAVPLVTARITNDNRAQITIHAAGAAMVPGMPSSADSQLDIPLNLLP